jgi:hypothetical protein
LIFCFGIICSIAFFNATGVAVTKYASAAQRSTIDTSRTLLIWFFFLFYPNKDVREKFIWTQLVGFILLVIGTLVFNEIIIIPFLGFNQNTKGAIEKRKLQAVENGEDVDENGLLDGTKDEKDENGNDYLAVSPATYNYNRNYRNVKNHMTKASNGSKRNNLQMSGTEPNASLD